MAGYIGTTPVPQATQHRESFTATGGQTSFATVGYTPQFIDVYLNGVKLAPADYTATNGSDVVLASGATASDILEIVAYTPFEIASQTFTGDTTANNFAVTGTFTSRGIDDNADAVAITIDSSGNLLVGTTSTSISNEGAVIFPSGVMTITNDGGRPLRLNRKTSDGNILDFDKDGTTVGSIGTVAGDLTIGDDDIGIRFDTGAGLVPWDLGATATGGSARDAAIDIGVASARFKDLYLSGGVYLGGTGSDNFLNDYEHGFFTPTFGGLTTNPSGVTYDGTVGNEGFYVKVGRAVFIQINMRTDGITNVGAGTLVIHGLPFTTPDVTSQGGVATLAVSQSKDFAGENPSAAYITENTTYVTPFYRLTADGGSASSQCSDLGTGLNDNLIRIGGTYYVTV